MVSGKEIRQTLGDTDFCTGKEENKPGQRRGRNDKTLGEL